MTGSTPVTALVGGIMIGLSATAMMLFLGRIAGISGLIGQLIPPDRETSWRAAFLAGLLVAAPLWRLSTGSWPQQTVPEAPVLMLVAGCLVGFGSVWGNGCTSGHGVCGLARLSRRSLVATATFLAAAVLTTAVVRHGLGG